MVLDGLLALVICWAAGVGVLSATRVLVGRARSTAGPFGTLSLVDIILLAAATRDQSDTIKEFFKMKHAVLMMLLKSGVAFFVSLVTLLLKRILQQHETVMMSTLSDKQMLAILALLVITAVAIGIIADRIKRIPQEFTDATMISGILHG